MNLRSASTRAKVALVLCSALVTLASACKRTQPASETTSADLATTVREQYVPVVIYGSTSQGTVPADLPEKVRAAVFRLARQSQPLAGPANAPIALFKTLASVDQAFSDEIASGELGTALAGLDSRSYGDYTLEAMLVPANDPETAALRRLQEEGDAADQLRTQALGLIWGAALVGASDNDRRVVGDLVEIAANAIVLRKTTDLTSPYTLGFKAYQQIARDRSVAYLPVYGRLEATYSRRGLGLSADARLKPVPVYEALTFTRPSDPVHMRYMSWAPVPTFATNQPAVIYASYERSYGAGAFEQKPLLHVGFGRLVANDVRQRNSCVSTCAREIELVPTAIGEIHAENIPAVRQLPLGSRIVSGLQSAFGNYTSVKILFKDLYIDLTDPAGPTVMPDRSRASIILGAGNSVIQFDAEHDQVAGLNIYQRFVAAEFANAVTPDVRASLAAFDARVNASINGSLKPILDAILR